MSDVFTQTLAQFVIETPTADVPDAVLLAAQDALTDTVGVAIAGTLEPVSGIATNWLREVDAAPRATVWGQRLSTSSAEAAFANGVSSHALDFDDTHPGTRGHSSATLVPAVLAVGEVAGVSGVDVLVAYALALEVAAKIGRASGPGHIERGWHPTATIGIFGATAAAARLAGLDVAGLQRAWGLAASQMSGLVRNFGTMTKPFHAGHASRCGVVSAWMARSGFTADENVFDGKGGVLDLYRGDDGDAMENLLRSLGRRWELIDPGNYVKRWPCCYSNHRPLGALLQITEEDSVHADEISEVAIGFLPGTDTALVSRDPATGLEAKFSVEYVVAAMLIDRKLTLETFTDVMVHRPRVRNLMRKVRRYAIPDDKVYSGIAGYTDVTVTTPRGRFERRVDRVPGSPAWPLTEADRVAKFMDCATRVLSSAEARRLLDLCRQLRSVPDIRQLLQATVPNKREEAS
ncbi:MAG TPA: MmgE/PrpD family protein [Burkholderiales bacterium]|nr:MmgE/PrpD family protein [Burkholderiales bacterium]